MPYRRRRRKKKRKSTKQFRFRTNNINAAGGRPYIHGTRLYKTVTAGHLLCTATTCGNEAAFNLMDWSAPADPDVTTFTKAGTTNNVPSDHAAILGDGFDRVKVLNAFYRFNCRFKGDDNVAQDWIFAYRFSNVSTAIFVHTAGTTGIDNWKDLRQSRGWTYKRMSATHSGGSIHPTAAEFKVRISNVQKMAKYFQKASATEHTDKDYTHVISSGADSATVDLFLHIVIMTIDGIALSAADIQIDVDVYQKVRLWKDISGNRHEGPGQEA